MKTKSPAIRIEMISHKLDLEQLSNDIQVYNPKYVVINQETGKFEAVLLNWEGLDLGHLASNSTPWTFRFHSTWA